MVKILCISPKDDASSRTCGKWADSLTALFPNLIQALTTKSRGTVDSALGKCQHVLYFGHGEPDGLIVPPGLLRPKVTLADGSNLPGVPDRIVIAVACWSGDKLGGNVTDNFKYSTPVECFVGWMDDISWPDEWPDPIGEAIVKGVSSLCAGQSGDTCKSDLEDAFMTAHNRYRNEGGMRGMASDRVAFGKMCALYWRDRITLHGKGAATI
jgi:hypothetical protein